MLLHHAVDHRQTEARALADFLGGEEGLEDAFQDARRDARPRVGNRQPHETSWGQVGMPGAVLLSEQHVFRFDQQFAAGRHGVAGVDAQVHHRLLQHGGVDVQPAHALVEVHFQIDVFADQRAEHPFQIPEDFVGVRFQRFQFLPPAEA